jgi:hydrogenase nickel incorporation protein HypA/HybF
MHELSIAHSIVTIVEEALGPSPQVVKTVRLRLGPLSGVVRDALEFSFSVATSGTRLEGASLDFIEDPLEVHCDACGTVGPPESLQRFRCRVCGAPAGKVVSGQSLEVEQVEVA